MVNYTTYPGKFFSRGLREGAVTLTQNTSAESPATLVALISYALNYAQLLSTWREVRRELDGFRNGGDCP